MLATSPSKPFASYSWKATDGTVFQKGFQQGSEELQTGMFIISAGYFHKIYNKE